MEKPILLCKCNLQGEERINGVESLLKDKCPDYNILIVSHQSFKIPEFEVLNAKGLRPVEFEELKELVTKQNYNHE